MVQSPTSSDDNSQVRPEESGPDFTEVFIRASDVKAEGVCPQCECNTTLVEGVYSREFVQEISDGQTTGRMLGRRIVKEVRFINCGACRTRFEIVPDDVFDLTKSARNLSAERERREALIKMPPAGTIQ